VRSCWSATRVREDRPAARRAQRAREAGVLVLAASAAEFELELPYSGLSQVALPLRTTLDELGPAPPGGARRGAGPARWAPASAGRRGERGARAAPRGEPLARGTAAGGRLALAGPGECGGLSSIARRVSSLPVGLVATVRTGASTAFDRSGLVEYELRPLDEDACVRLLRSRFAELPRVELTRLVSESRGNPLACSSCRGPAAVWPASAGRRSPPRRRPSADVWSALRRTRRRPAPARNGAAAAKARRAARSRPLAAAAATFLDDLPSPSGWTWCPWTTSCPCAVPPSPRCRRGGGDVHGRGALAHAHEPSPTSRRRSSDPLHLAGASVGPDETVAAP
jgi:hypothetical protein